MVSFLKTSAILFSKRCLNIIFENLLFFCFRKDMEISFQLLPQALYRRHYMAPVPCKEKCSHQQIYKRERIVQFGVQKLEYKKGKKRYCAFERNPEVEQY